MSHDHHMMGHDDHGSHVMPVAAVDSIETTTHDHGSMKTEHAHTMMGMTMQMYFEAGYKATILFEQWNTDSIGAMVGSCIGIFLLAIIYEGLKFFREKLHRKNYVAIDYSKVRGSQDSGNGATEVTQTKTAVTCKTSMTSASHYIQTALHALQLVISYFLMLIVMTYNVWLFLSVVLGCTVGYFLFGWQKGFLFDITEHCH